MRTRSIVIAGVAISLFAPTAAPAQAERYELGDRLKRFEAEWESADEAAHHRALRVIRPVSRQFLTFQLAEAARTLDEARFALRQDKPSLAERWLASLAVTPERRLIDANATELPIEVRALYRLPEDPPPGLEATLTFGSGRAVPVPLEKLPATVTVPLPATGAATTSTLRLKVTNDGRRIGVRGIAIHTRPDLGDYLRRWKKYAAIEPPEGILAEFPAGIELATLRDKAAVVTGLSNGDVPESEVPLDDWDREAADIVRIGAVGGRYFVPGRWLLPRAIPEQFTFTVPTGGKFTPCRAYIPQRLTDPVPIVVALHGMGGSENLFFEGYGAGCVVNECAKRGWVLVSPRSPTGFLGGPPPVPEIVEKLADRYPIDRSRVLLVGHSMGAGQAVELTQRHPGRFAAVAALGGGGRVRNPDPFADLPVFIGVGTEDFARGGAAQLHKAIRSTAHVTYREYPDVEHMVIVRAAVEDLFELFDTARK